MRKEDFREGVSPGKLEVTEFITTRLKRGIPEATPIRGWAFVPDELPPSKVSSREVKTELFDEIQSAERSLALLEGSASRLPNPYLLIGPFMTREAMLSSAIENTFASAREMALFEMSESAVSERDRVQEVVNYQRALQYGLDSQLPTCSRLMLEMHKRLLGGLKRTSIHPGRFRTTQNAIGGDNDFAVARFVPPPPGHINRLISNLEKYMNSSCSDSAEQLPLLARLAVSHYQFEAIHPFDDGNGRLGRLLVVLQLCQSRRVTKPLVYVSGYFEKHRERYYELLYTVSAEADWISWIRFFVTAIDEQATDARALAESLLQLREELHARVRQKRASALLPDIVDSLFRRPSITVPVIHKTYGISPTAAGSLVDKLVECGVLIEATGRKKDRVFVAPEIIDAIEGKRSVHKG